MTAPWVAGKTYVPGSLVRPLTKPPAVSAAPTNAGFESGDLTGWTASAGWSVVGGSQYAGAYCAQLAAAAGDDLTLTNTNQVPITPGQVINCSLRVKQGAAGSGNAGALIRMHWYDASHAEIGHNDGDAIYNGGGSYKTAYLRAVAPTGAAFAAFGIGAWDHSPSHPMWVDDAAWDYTYAGPISGLIYKAVQPNPGKSGSNEPAWPPVNGETVVDNQVIWEAVLATRLVWQASPLMVSGTTEPDWPEVNGGTVRDGSIDWIAQTTQILDVNCPPSKIVAIAAGKVYAADNDIIRYCATVNPLDWTTQDDAGYLPFGLQTYGSNPVAAMGLYRSNLVAFNSEGFQMWQVDEDPASTALLDALPIGSTQNRALAPVANDLFFLSSQGVRTVGIAAGSTNLQAGDVGMPIDSLVQQAMKLAIANGAPPISTYVPSAGQYWLVYSDFPPGAPSLSGNAVGGNIGVAYSYGYTAAGGVGPYVFSITVGSLPDGLTINVNTGVVSGTPTTEEVSGYSVTVTDSVGQHATLPDSIDVGGPTLEFAVLQDSPIIYLPLNEATGSVASDLSGFERDGAYVGPIVHSTVELRPGSRCTQFGASGIGAYVAVSDDGWGDIFLTDTWSVEIIFRRDGSIAGSADYPVAKFISPNTGYTSMGMHGNIFSLEDQLTGQYFDESNAAHSINTPDMTLSDPHIYVLVRDGDTLYLYVDGEQSTSHVTGTQTGNNNATLPLTIGGEQNFPNSYQFDGLISDVSVYDHALSSARALVHAQAAGFA
jgi:hypothetical protein